MFHGYENSEACPERNAKADLAGHCLTLATKGDEGVEIWAEDSPVEGIRVGSN